MMTTMSSLIPGFREEMGCPEGSRVIAYVEDGLKTTDKMPERRVFYRNKNIYGTQSPSTRLRIMAIYGPRLSAQPWPETVKETVVSHFHRLMASLTEQTTELYCEGELESILVGWTRQIKEILSKREVEASPLEEIDFWRSRARTLECLAAQLERTEVKRVRTQLANPRFEALISRVETNLSEATENLKFLEHLVPPCEALRRATPTEICELVPEILTLMRIFANLSNLNVNGLLRKLSSEIIGRCCATIRVEDIFDNPKMAILALEDSVKCGTAWKRENRKLMAVEKDWSQNNSVFAQIDAFVQRCRDLTEVCEASLQFASPFVEIELQFRAQVEKLKNLKYSMLDVKTSKWQSDFSTFKNSVKDLEVMYCNMMAASFEGVTFKDAAALVEVYKSLALRDAIVRSVEKKNTDCYVNFIKLCDETRLAFDENRRNPAPEAPTFSGAARWAKSKADSIKTAWSLLGIPCRSRRDAHQTYQNLLKILNDYISSRYAAWIESLQQQQQQFDLETPLIVRKQQVECNLDARILATFEEIQGFEKLEFPIPYFPLQREKLRLMSEQVMQVVFVYNKIHLTKLFSDHVRRLDKRVFTKLTWSTTKVETYVRECCANCDEILRIVGKFKALRKFISKECQSIASLVLVKFDSKAFEQTQADHRSRCKNILRRSHAAIRQALDEIRSLECDSREFQQLCQNVDKDIETSLRATIRKSLHELSRAINTEHRTLFSLNLLLEERLEFRPSMISLTHVVNVVAKEIISTVSVIPRDGPSFYASISNDEDMLKIVVSVMNGMSSTATLLQKFLSHWDKYKPIYEMDKDSYIRRYAKANRTLHHFTDDITKYKNFRADISAESMSQLINFVKVDCSQLKAKLIAHCQEWESKLLALLNQNARVELEGLLATFETKFGTPESLEDLSSKLEILENLKQLPLESKIGPLEETYATLARFDVVSEEAAKVQNLRKKFHQFQEKLATAETDLEEAKRKLRRGLEASLEQYEKSAAMLKEAQLPISETEDPKILTDLKSRVRALNARLEALGPGLAIFGIPKPESFPSTDLDRCDALWQIYGEWQKMVETWENTEFRLLKPNDLDADVRVMSRRVEKIPTTTWPLSQSLKERIDAFSQRILLLRNLQNPSLRDHHWAQLPISKTAQLKATDGLSSEFVAEVGAAAERELAIATTVNDIRIRWETTNSTETLEDDRVQIATMRSQSDDDPQLVYWEKKLAEISEFQTLVSEVEEKYLYFEKIFEDTSNFLPRELFEKVRFDYYENLKKADTVLRFCETKAETVATMGTTLDEIQKSLDTYLDSKRQIFPRFYFLSDELILKILAAAAAAAAKSVGDKNNIQTYIPYLFEWHAMECKNGAVVGMRDATNEIAPIQPVVIDGRRVEKWLGELEQSMISGMKDLLAQAVRNPTKLEANGQVLIAASEIQFGIDYAKMKRRALKKKQHAFVAKLLGELPRAKNRQKIVSLLTAELHHRDILEASDFQWEAHLRFTFANGLCAARQLNYSVDYGYNYHGNATRLVVTPLTDRCILTLLAARAYHRVGCAVGSSGVGKTETIKHVAQHLAHFLVFIDCSSSCSSSNDIARMLSGVCQSGAWACLDDVLLLTRSDDRFSVFSMHVISILDALSRQAPTFSFLGHEIRCLPSCGIFATATTATTTTTDAVLAAALVRPVAMVAPDIMAIVESLLIVEGYAGDTRLIAKKISTFSSSSLRELRAIISRSSPSEEDLMRRIALTPADRRLLDAPKKLTPKDQLAVSVLPSNILVGPTMSGKTTAWKTLAAKENKTVRVINPALSRELPSSSSSSEDDWVVVDGVMDTAWVESLHPRIELERVIFEVSDLKNFSPATISRVAVIHFEEEKEEGVEPTTTKYLSLLGVRRAYEPVPTKDASLLKAFRALSSDGKKSEKECAFAAVWSLCCTVNDEGRKVMDVAMREVTTSFPRNGTIYDFYVKNDTWELWDVPVRVAPRSSSSSFYSLVVPTVDTVRHDFVFKAIEGHLLVTGDCCGKTTALKPLATLSITVSPTTSARSVHEKLLLEAGRVLVDDLHVAPGPVEAMRFYADNNACREKPSSSSSFMAAMRPAKVCDRFRSRCHSVHLTKPQTERIFEAILGNKTFAHATVAVYDAAVKTFLPTPEKPFNHFTIRDVARVVQGLYGKELSPSLWVHECRRVFADRFDLADRTTFDSILRSQKFEIQEEEEEDDDDDDEKIYFAGDEIEFPKLKDRIISECVVDDLILFPKAVLQVAKIHRILTMDRGHALLVGQGRRSLALLASRLAGYDVVEEVGSYESQTTLLLKDTEIPPSIDFEESAIHVLALGSRFNKHMTVILFEPWDEESLLFVGDALGLGPEATALHLRAPNARPSQFLDLARVYADLVAERDTKAKRKQEKIVAGLEKIQEAKAAVAALSSELDTKKVQYLNAQKKCESLLVEIVTQRRAADAKVSAAVAEIEAGRIPKVLETIFPKKEDFVTLVKKCKNFDDDDDDDYSEILDKIKHLHVTDQPPSEGPVWAWVSAVYRASTKKYDDAVTEKNNIRVDEAERRLDRARKVLEALERWWSSSSSQKETPPDDNNDDTASRLLEAAAFVSYAGPLDFDERRSFFVDFDAGAFFDMDENLAIIQRARRPLLVVDPQGYAITWISNTYNPTVIEDSGDALDEATTRGVAVLIEVGEAIDPALAQRLKSPKDSRIFLVTKHEQLRVPDDDDDVSVLDISLRRSELEERLLRTVVSKEQPALERQATDLAARLVAGRARLADLDDEFLQSTDVLKTAKERDEILRQVSDAREAQRKINAKRDEYRPCAIRAAILFEILDSLKQLDPTYQYSFDEYLESDCLGDSKHVYQTTCRGLAERHRLVFGLQLCLVDAPRDAVEFLCHGSRTTTIQDNKPDWCSQDAWNNACELGLDAKVEEWKEWYHSPSAANSEKLLLPNNSESEIKRLCIVRGLRIDQFPEAAKRFVAATLGPDPGFDLLESFKSSKRVLVLKDVDPSLVHRLARDLGKTLEPPERISEAADAGSWVLFTTTTGLYRPLEKIPSNCHPDFRVWISLSPTKIPISVLQHAVKISGGRAPVMMIPQTVFPLCWFHSVLTRRWRAYDFSFDFEIAKEFASIYEKDLLRHVVSDVIYAGRITDPQDLRVLHVYSQIFLDDQAPPPEEFYPCPSKKDARALLDVLFDRHQNPTVDDVELPEPLDTLVEGDSPVDIVVAQEIDYYNKILATLRDDLPKTTDDNTLLFYPSVKPLGSWFKDLHKRVEFFRARDFKVFWLPAFTNPRKFLSALLVETSRATGVAFDALTWDFPVVTDPITQRPTEGAYCSGLLLEGARLADGALCDPFFPISPMPVIHFKPTTKKQQQKGLYACPLYMCPRQAYVISVDLQPGQHPPSVWITRATALLLSDYGD